MMGKKSKQFELVKNTIVIFFSKFCTQFISFFLIPVYTKFLNTSDYGYIDLVQSYVALMVPILLLRMDSAVFRFLIDNRSDEKNKSKIISTSIYMCFIEISICITISLIINYFINIKYFTYIILNIITMAIFTILLQVSRGLGKNNDYAIASIICGLLNVLLTTVLIIFFNMDAYSILIASSIGNVLASIYLAIKNNVFHLFNKENVDKDKLKEMLKYSLPMIPDGLSWWMVNVSDRTIISFMIGDSMNGVYAVSSKFANIIQSFSGVFNITWQESASVHINEDDRDTFFSQVLDNSLRIFSSISVIILIFLPLVFNAMVGEKYRAAYFYIPVLLLGNIFNALSNVLGGAYIAKKITKKVAKTTMLCALVNIIINIIFINKFGLWAASISTLIAYVFLFIYRFIDIKKFVVFKINIRTLLLALISLLIVSILYYVRTFYSILINLLFGLIVIVLLNKNNIKSVLLFLKSKIVKER